MGCKEGGKQNGDTGGVHGIGGYGILPCHLEFANNQQSDADQKPDSHPHRGLQPTRLYGVPQEKDTRQCQGNSRNPREELDSYESLPIESRPGGRRNRGRRGFRWAWRFHYRRGSGGWDPWRTLRDGWRFLAGDRYW